MHQIRGNNLIKKIDNFDMLRTTTDINKILELLLNVSLENNIVNDEIPSYIFIIGSSEFDKIVKSKNGTNLNSWKKGYNKHGYNLPKVIFGTLYLIKKYFQKLYLIMIFV